MVAMERLNGRWSKTCSGCQRTFTVNGLKWDEGFLAMQTHFYEYKSSGKMPPDSLHGNCKECHCHVVHRRDNNGSTRAEMLAAQDDKCAICKNPIAFNDRTAVIDHNHKTRKIRGLLCIGCNTGIGSFEENTISLHNAINYLKSHNEDN